jgi:uncharacterized repeat protein (TIGR03803 family)
MKTFSLHGRKPVWALLVRLLCSAALLLPGFTALAGVVLTTVCSFQGESFGNAADSLVQGSDGNLYGTSEIGGMYSGGFVFRVSPNGTLTNIYSFTEGSDGGDPEAGLALGGDGFFYGTASDNGSADSGTVFQISTNGALTTLYTFTGGSDGAQCSGLLVQGGDGNFYGTAQYGGDFGDGTVFTMPTNGDLNPFYSFSGDDGANPQAGLAQGSDG